jgi:hypothetical protein
VADLLRPDDTRDALRKIGALLFGLGILMLLLRKEVVADDMSKGVVLILLAIPAALLYGGGVFTAKDTGGARPWQAVWSVFGLIFVALALIQFVTVLDETPDAALNFFWIFAVVAALAFYAGAVVGIRFHLLAGSIALIISWSALWDKILGDEGIAGHVGTYRGLLGILAIILLAAGIYLWRSAPEARVGGTGVSDGGDARLWKASELLTGAGIAAVLACSLGITAVTNLNPLAESSAAVETSNLWDVLLLLISLGLVGIGSTIGTRGPVYVGVIGLIFFLTIVGLDLNEDSPDPSKVGMWPWILLVLGGVGILVSAVKESSLGDQPRQFVNKLKSG